MHCLHAAHTGSHKIAIRTVDTDVVVLAISNFTALQFNELWIHFGVGKNVRIIAAHDISNALGPEKSKALPVFHCFTGCDTVSCFAGRGQKTAWEAWNSYFVVTQAFLNLHDDNEPEDIDLATFSVLERFVIIMYDITSDCIDLDTSRRQLFTKKCRPLESLPPTADAFVQHVLRTTLQAIQCWSHCFVKQTPVLYPEKWGWLKEDDKWIPFWGKLPEASKICNELLRCSCKKGCVARCKCVKAKLQCTALCQCDGKCKR